MPKPVWTRRWERYLKALLQISRMNHEQELYLESLREKGSRADLDRGQSGDASSLES